MIQGNEFVMLVIGVAVFSFSLAYKDEMKRIPQGTTLRLAFYVFLFGWVATIAEGFFWGTALNYMEHLCYVCSSLLLVAWCWKVSFGSKAESK